MVSCKPENECEKLTKKIEIWNQRMTLHPRAYSNLEDSIFSAYTKAEEINCENSLGMALEYKLWYYTQQCKSKYAIDYISQLEASRFSYPNKKEMYLNLYRAMKAWSSFDEVSHYNFLLQAEEAAKKEYDETGLFDAMIDRYMCRSLYVEKAKLSQELDSLYHISNDENYLYIVSLIEKRRDILNCFGPIRYSPS